MSEFLISTPEFKILGKIYLSNYIKLLEDYLLIIIMLPLLQSSFEIIIILYLYIALGQEYK